MTPWGNLGLAWGAVAAASCAPALQVTTSEPVAPGKVHGGFVAPVAYWAKGSSSEGAAPFASRQESLSGASFVPAVAVLRAGLSSAADVGVTAAGREAAIDLKLRVAHGSTGGATLSVALDPLVDVGFKTLAHSGGALPIMAGVRFGEVGVYASAGPGLAVVPGRKEGRDADPLDLRGPYLRSSLGVRLELSRHFALHPEYQRRDWFRDGTVVHGAGLGFVWGDMR